jgi:hypothetical protein
MTMSFVKLRNAFLIFIARRTPHCDEITRLVSESMDRRLSTGERIKVRLHFYVCYFCERYARQVRLLRTAMQKVSDARQEAPSTAEFNLSPEIKDRLKSALTDTH